MSSRFAKRNKRKTPWSLILIGIFIIVVYTQLPQRMFNLLERPLERAWQVSAENRDRTQNFFASWFVGSQNRAERERLEQELLQTELTQQRAIYLEAYLEQLLNLSFPLIPEEYEFIEELLGEGAVLSETGMTETITSETESILDALVESTSNIPSIDRFAGVENLPELIPAQVVFKGGTAGSILVINQGQDAGLVVGDLVISHQHFLLAEITHVFDTTAYARLLGYGDTEVRGILSPALVSINLEGYGLGYRAEVPRGVPVSVGDVVYHQTELGYVLAMVQEVNFDPRNPFQEVLLNRPVSLNNVTIVGLIKPLPILPDLIYIQEQLTIENEEELTDLPDSELNQEPITEESAETENSLEITEEPNAS